MNSLKIILLIISVLIAKSESQNAEGKNYSCEKATKKCTLKNFNSYNDFVNFLSSTSQVKFPYYDYYNQGQTYLLSTFVRVEFQSSKFDKFPTTFFSRFSGISQLLVKDVGLKDINSEDFRLAANLKLLNLQQNEIKSLENVQFIYLTLLEEINLSHNEISSIHESAFYKLSKNIKKINLSYNKIAIFKEEFLWLIVENMLSSWLNLNLENNEMTEWVVTYNNKSSVVALNLNLNDNKLKTVEIKNIKIKKLSLSNNQIEVFNGTYEEIEIVNNKIIKFRVSENCTIVKASNNRISELEFPTDNDQITTLDFSSNNLKSTPDFNKFLKAQKKMISLDLSHNFFGSFMVDDFAEMENLKELSLSENRLSEIPFGLFAHLKSLELLNISQNNLKSIDFHMFSSLSNLKSLDVSGNSLTKVDQYEQLRVMMPQLLNISLESNNWNCENLSKLKISLNAQSIKINEPQNPVKNESSVMGIKCTEKFPVIIQEVGNSTVDDATNEKLNEIIRRVNQIDGKVATMKANETNFMSLIVDIQKNLLDIKSDNLKEKISSGNFSNINEVKMLIDQMNNLTMEKQQIEIKKLLHSLAELSLKIEQTKFDNEKLLLALQKSQLPPENFSALKSNVDKPEKSVGITTVEFMLGILLTMTLTLLIVMAVFQAKNFMKRNVVRMPRMSGRSTPNTIITYDSQSVA